MVECKYCSEEATHIVEEGDPLCGSGDCLCEAAREYLHIREITEEDK